MVVMVCVYVCAIDEPGAKSKRGSTKEYRRSLRKEGYDELRKRGNRIESGRKKNRDACVVENTEIG